MNEQNNIKMNGNKRMRYVQKLLVIKMEVDDEIFDHEINLNWEIEECLACAELEGVHYQSVHDAEVKDGEVYYTTQFDLFQNAKGATFFQNKVQSD